MTSSSPSRSPTWSGENSPEPSNGAGEDHAAASGSGAPAPSALYSFALSRMGTLDVRGAAAWLASSLLLRSDENREEKREIFRNVVNRSPMFSPVRMGGAEVDREETLIHGQSPWVALYFANTKAVVRAVGRLDPSLLRGLAGERALIRASGVNLPDVVRELLIAGVDPNVSSPHSGSTPAHNAALKGHTMCLQLLAEYGADLNARLPHAGTPLHLAALHGHTACVDVLVTMGADVNVACAQGLTPLHVAVLAGHEKCLPLLMTRANSKLRDVRGHEPICYAVEKEDILMGRTIVALQRCYTNINIAEPEGYPTCGHNMARIYEACLFGMNVSFH